MMQMSEYNQTKMNNTNHKNSEQGHRSILNLCGSQQKIAKRDLISHIAASQNKKSIRDTNNKAQSIASVRSRINQYKSFEIARTNSNADQNNAGHNNQNQTKNGGIASKKGKVRV
jgi:hypothetical protein